MATTVVIVRRSDGSEQRLLLVGLLGVGVLIAISGWVGVAWRQSPRALDDGVLGGRRQRSRMPTRPAGYWPPLPCSRSVRSSPNASRARIRSSRICSSSACSRLESCRSDRFCGRPRDVDRLDTWTGDLAKLDDLRGLALAFAALLPSMPSSDQPRPALALVGLTLGAVISVASARFIGIVAVGVTIALVTMSGLRHSAIDAGSRVRDGRITTNSSDRSHELHAALELARTHAIAGVGPGHVDLAWDVATPVPQTVHVADRG